MIIEHRRPLDNLVLTPKQAKQALHIEGKLDQVNAFMADPATDPLTKIAWETSINYVRQSSTVNGVANQLGWTSAEVDQIFITGAGITP